MANSDSAAQNVRFNLDSQQLEFALGVDWVAVPTITPGEAVWGSITGTLADQTDLQTALDARTVLAGAFRTVVDTNITDLVVFPSAPLGFYRLSLTGYTNFVSGNSGTETFTLSWTDNDAHVQTVTIGTLDLTAEADYFTYTIAIETQGGDFTVSSSGGTFSGGNAKMNVVTEFLTSLIF